MKRPLLPLAALLIVLIVSSACAGFGLFGEDADSAEPAPPQPEPPETAAPPTPKLEEAEPEEEESEEPQPVEPNPEPESPASIPDAPLSSTGPWAFVAGEFSIRALNPDGSGITSIYDPFSAWGNVQRMILSPAPQGGNIALLKIENTFELSNPELFIFHLPEGTVNSITTMMPPDFDPDAYSGDERVAVEQVWAAVGVHNNLVWSSDGSKLAFHGAFEGPSADVYVYSLDDGSFTRLTDGPSQSVDLVWSPNDEYLLHGAASTLYYGYSGLGYGMQNVWAAPIDDRDVLKVFDSGLEGFEQWIAWYDNTTYLGDSFEMMEGNFNLREINILTGDQETLIAGSYEQRAFSPTSRKTLLCIPTFVADQSTIGTAFDVGVYLFDNTTEEALPLPEIDADEVNQIQWDDAAHLFFVVVNDGLFTVDTNGNVFQRQAPPNIWNDPIVVDGEGLRWALNSSYDGVLAVGDSYGNYTVLDVEDAHHPMWSPDGETLLFIATWEGGPSLLAANAPDFEPLLVEKGVLQEEGPVLVP